MFWNNQNPNALFLINNPGENIKFEGIQLSSYLMMKSIIYLLILFSIAFCKYSYSDKCYQFEDVGSAKECISLTILSF